MASGYEAEWTGDRCFTLVKYLDGLDDVKKLLGEEQPAGWITPEKMPGMSGRTRKRALRWRGYLLVMTHEDQDDKGANKVVYCLETKTLYIHLALAFFGANLKFVTGVAPPDKDSLEFDIVTRELVDRTSASAAVWTEARARNHFGEA